jgi:hypothetical protein
MSKKEIIKAAVAAGYRAVCDELEKHGIKFDAGSMDCIFCDDTEGKKTYAITVSEHECDEYEGE